MTDNGGFTISGVPATTYGVTLMYGPNQPMLPNTKDRVAEVLGRVGSLFISSDVGSKSFSLPCQFRDCETASELDALIKTLARALVDINGRAKHLSLIFDDSPTLTYTVRYSGQISFDRKWVGCTDFTLDLIADDPLGYEEETETEATITGDPESMSVYSSGDISTPAIVKIENTGAATVSGFELKTTIEVK